MEARPEFIMIMDLMARMQYMTLKSVGQVAISAKLGIVAAQELLKLQ